MDCKNQVLIVESSRTALSDIIRDLTAAGVDADIRVALNGGHALLHIKQLHISNKIENLNMLVILNLLTPIVNGIEFLKEFSEDSSLSKNKIKIAVISDNLTPQEIENAELLGVQNFISTPLTINQLNTFAGSFFQSLEQENEKKEQAESQIKKSQKTNKNIKNSAKNQPSNPG